MHAWTKIILKMKKFVSWKRKRYSWLYSSISFIFSIIFMSILLLQLWTLSYSFFITFLSYNAHKIQLFQRKPEQSFSCQTLSSYSKVVATMVRSQWEREFLLGTICAICSLLFFLIWNARGGVFTSVTQPEDALMLPLARQFQEFSCTLWGFLSSSVEIRVSVRVIFFAFHSVSEAWSWMSSSRIR